MKQLLNFIQTNPYLLSYGVLLTFLSSFGQTFVISLYLPSIQQAFQLSDSGFSSIYSGATILSALTLTWLGPFIDKQNIIKYTVLVMAGLIVMLIVMSQAYVIIVLIFAIYGLRLMGQGLLTHTSITAMARFFANGRGKAISIATLGHPIGEMLLPFIVVSTIYALGWRYALALSALFVALSIPVILRLLKKKASFTQRRTYIPDRFSRTDKQQANPLNIVKDKAFWLIMPSSLVAASIGTGFLLFKLKMGLSYGWSPTFVAVGFSAYAVGSASFNLVGGILADKYSGKFLFIFYLIPAMLGVAALLISSDEWVYIALVGGIGITSGFGGTVKNVALTEMYGVKIIGSARSLFITFMVFSTALGPLIFGTLLDNGFSFEQITLFAVITYGLATLNTLRIIRWS